MTDSSSGRKAAPAPGEARRRSRRALLDLLKREGSQDAASLGRRLGVTAMAVRQHLYDMQAEGLADHGTAPRAIGRPAKLWRLTPAADRLFPDGHADLTLGLLEAMAQAFGEDGMRKLLLARTDRQVADYSSSACEADTVEDRLRRLAERRCEEGYMAEVAADGEDAWLFIENHCPIRGAAQACSGLCAAELTLFQRVLGSDVSVRRTDHILAGAHRCAYRIAPNAKREKRDA